MEEIKAEQPGEEELDDDIGGINITPLVDVALTLVLIFMVVMPSSIIQGITVRGQLLKQYGLSQPQENVRVHLTPTGIYVKDEKGAEKKIVYDHFGIVLSEMIQLSPTKRLLLHCEPEVPHGQAVWVLDLAKQNGATDLSLVEGNP